MINATLCILVEQITSEGSIIKHLKVVKTRMEGWVEKSND